MHELPVSLGAAIDRILSSCHTLQLVLSVQTSRLLKETKHEITAISRKKERVVRRFHHAVSNNQKSSAQQFDLDLVFRNDFPRLTPFQKEKPRRTKKHQDPTATCEMGLCTKFSLHVAMSTSAKPWLF